MVTTLFNSRRKRNTKRFPNVFRKSPKNTRAENNRVPSKRQPNKRVRLKGTVIE